MRTKIFFHAHRNFAPCLRKGNEEASPSSPYAQSVNPRDVIAGGFSKRGFIVLHAIEERVRPETLIVSYGELGLSPRAKYKREPTVEAELLQRVSFCLWRGTHYLQSLSGI